MEIKIPKRQYGDYPRGSRNNQWRGGVSEYPNHHEMKRNRLIKLKESNGKCEVCGSPANCVHHLDGSKDNHDLDNLAILCKKCHRILHNGRNNTSKYKREYGMTLSEMALEFGGSPSLYHKMHQEGKLRDFLNEQESPEPVCTPQE